MMLTNTITSTQTSLLPPRTLALLLLEVEERRDHQPELDDHDREQERDDLLGLQVGHGRSICRRSRSTASGRRLHPCTDPARAPEWAALDSAGRRSAASLPRRPPGGPDDRRPRALGAHPRRLERDGRGDRRWRSPRPATRSPASTSTSGPALTHVEEVKAAIAAAGSEALFINMNAADDEKRAAAIATLRARFDESRAAGRHPYLRVVMHSLAFGSLVPFLADDPKDAVDRKKMEMTQDVMANSLVYWVQDLLAGRVPRDAARRSTR